MSKDRSEFSELMRRVSEGSPEAAWEVIARYGPHIHRVVRRKLSSRIRQQYGSSDFLQSVWGSFFAHPRRRFDRPEELIAYLVGMAKNKIRYAARRQATQKHDVTREQPLDEFEMPANAFVAKQATPDQIAIARECWKRLIDGQPVRNRKIIELRIQGATFAEIAKKLEIHERTARRLIKNLLVSLARSA